MTEYMQIKIMNNIQSGDRAETRTEHVQLSDAYAYLAAQRLHRFQHRFNPREELKLMHRIEYLPNSAENTIQRGNSEFSLSLSYDEVIVLFMMRCHSC